MRTNSGPHTDNITKEHKFYDRCVAVDRTDIPPCRFAQNKYDKTHCDKTPSSKTGLRTTLVYIFVSMLTQKDVINGHSVRHKQTENEISASTCV